MNWVKNKPHFNHVELFMKIIEERKRRNADVEYFGEGELSFPNAEEFTFD